MAEKNVFVRGIADFSQMRREAEKTKRSFEDLKDESNDLSHSNDDLSDSERRLADETGKSTRTRTQAYRNVINAQQKAAQGSHSLSDAYNRERVASAQSSVESARRTRALLAERDASDKVDQAATTLKQRREAITTATRKLQEAEHKLAQDQAAGRKTTNQLAAEENKVVTARNQLVRATRSAEQAERSLLNAKSREQRVIAQNALSQAKADQQAVASAARRAQAEETAYNRQRAASEKMYARLFDDIQKADQQEEALRQRTIARNNAVQASYKKLYDMRIAQEQAAQRATNAGLTGGTSNARLDNIRGVIAGAQNKGLTAKEQLAVDALTRAENNLTSARKNVQRETIRTNEAERVLAAARAGERNAIDELDRAYVDHNNTVRQYGADSRQAAQSSLALSRSQLGLEQSFARVRDAEKTATRSASDLDSAYHRVQSTTGSLETAIHNAERTFRSGGAGSNFFSTGLNRAQAAADGFAKKLSGLRMAMRGMLWPALAGGAYLALSAISQLAAGVVSLTSAIGPAIGAVAALGPALFSLGTAGLSIFSAFKNVSGTLKAYSQAQNSALKQTGQTAAAEKNNATAIKAAKDRIAEARRNEAEVARDSARRIQDALRSQRQAEQDATREINDAIRSRQQAEEDAAKNITAARRNVGVVAQEGATAIASASHDIAQAQNQELQAQNALNAARKQAAQNIVAMKNAVIDAALAERGATLDLTDAQSNLQNVLTNPNASAADIARARLQVQQARQNLNEQKQATNQTDQTARQTTNRGVEGDAGVIAARRQLTQATYAVAKAQQAYSAAVVKAARNNKKAEEDLANAIEKAGRVRQKSDEAVAVAEQRAARERQRAEEDVTKAKQQGARDQRRAAEEVTAAVRALSRAQNTNNGYSSTAAKAADYYKNKLKQLAPAAQEFVKKLIAMRKYWTELQHTAQQNLFPGLTKALDIIPALFPIINKGVAETSRKLGQLAVQFERLFTQRESKNAFSRLFGDSPHLLQLFGSTLQNVFKIFRAVVPTAIPLANKLAKGIRDWTKGLADAAEQSRRSGHMADFFDRSYQVLHQLGQILHNIITTLHNIGLASTASGKSILNSIQRVTKGWAVWTSSLQGSNYLAKYFADARDNLKMTDHFLGVLAAGFLKLGASKNFKPIMDGLSAIFGAIKDAFGKDGNSLGILLGNFLQTIASLIRSFSANSSGLKVFLTTLNGIFKAINFLVQLPGVGPTIGAIAAAFAALAALRFVGLISGISRLTSGIVAFTRASRGGAGAARSLRAGWAGLRQRPLPPGQGPGTSGGPVPPPPPPRPPTGGAPVVTGGQTATREQMNQGNPFLTPAQRNAGSPFGGGSSSRRRFSFRRGVVTDPTNRLIQGTQNRLNQIRQNGNDAGFVRFGGGGTVANEQTPIRRTGLLGRMTGIGAARSTVSPVGEPTAPPAPAPRASRLGRVGRGLGRVAGGAGIAGIGLGGVVLGDVINDHRGGARQAVGGAISGAGQGALLGAMAGPEGAAAGAVIGGVIGLLTNSDLGKKLEGWFKSSILPGLKSVAGDIADIWKAFSSSDVGKTFFAFLKYLGDSLKRTFAVMALTIRAFKDLFTGNWKDLGKTLGKIWDNIWAQLKQAFSMFLKTMKLAWDMLSGLAKLIWKGISKAIVELWQVTWRNLKSLWNSFFQVIRAGWNAIANFAKNIWNSIYNSIKHIWDAVWNWAKDRWNKFWSGLKAEWNAVVGFAKNVWTAVTRPIINIWDGLWNGLKNVWGRFWNGLKAEWNAVVGTAKSIWSNVANAIGSAFGAVKSTVSSIWHDVETTIAGAINFITQDILNKLIHAINAVTHIFGISAIHDIPKITVNDTSNINNGNAPGAQSGAAGGGQSRAYARGGQIDTMLPGYTPGRDPHKFVSNTGLQIHLSGGEGILTPEATRAIGGKRGIQALNKRLTPRLGGDMGALGMAYSNGGMLGKFASGGQVGGVPTSSFMGTPDQKQGISTWLAWRLARKAHDDKNRSFFGDIGHAFGSAYSFVNHIVRGGLAWIAKKGFEVAESPLRGLADAIHVPVLKDVVNGLFNTVNSNIYNFIKGHSDTTEQSLLDGSGRRALHLTGQIDDPQDREDVMVSGLVLNNMGNLNGLFKNDAENFASTQASQNSSLIKALQIIIGAESGWNASAINLTDSNAKAGHPSQGLMQTIKPTYDAYKNPNMDRGMTDAISNVAAGVNYANSRYGGLTQVPGVVGVESGGSYVGYNRGGVLNFHSGGVVPGLNRPHGTKRQQRLYPKKFRPGSHDLGVSAIFNQIGFGFDPNAHSWSAAITQAFRRRLAGNLIELDGLAHPDRPPFAQWPSPTSSTNPEHWLYFNPQRNYQRIWSRGPFRTNHREPNQYHRNPIGPILDYLGNTKFWNNYANKHEHDVWAGLAAKDRKADSTRARAQQRNNPPPPTRGRAQPGVVRANAAANDGGGGGYWTFKNAGRIQRWLRNTVNNKGYIFGASGPGSYDCSGLVGEVIRRVKGQPGYGRILSTSNERDVLQRYGFRPGRGRDPQHDLIVGWRNNGSEGHTTGRIAGLPFEAYGNIGVPWNDQIRVGNNQIATPPESFPNVWHLAGNYFVHNKPKPDRNRRPERKKNRKAGDPVNLPSSGTDTAKPSYDLRHLMKRHPAVAKRLLKNRKNWKRSLAMLSSATKNEQREVRALNSLLGIHNPTLNHGIYGKETSEAMDHAAAHALGIKHPADWSHPWAGPVSPIERVIAGQQRATALQKEFNNDLTKIAGWGFLDLLNFLENLGVGGVDQASNQSGLSIARETVKDKKLASQLNTAIHNGTLASGGGPGGGDQDKLNQILQIVAKLSSAKRGHPFGLRDVSSYLNVPDYTVVDLYNDTRKYLKNLPAWKTQRFNGDVARYRTGVFYAASGGVVPGDMGMNRDVVAARLTPGEGIVNRQGMRVLGETGLTNLNNGMRPQLFANGGIALAPSVAMTGVTVGDAISASKIHSGEYRDNVPQHVEINTNINNPTGENSVRSMNKELQRQVVLGNVAKLTGGTR